MVAALGIGYDGTKTILGIWQGAMENATAEAATAEQSERIPLVLPSRDADLSKCTDTMRKSCLRVIFVTPQKPRINVNVGFHQWTSPEKLDTRR